jgi:superfamily II DNA or RNA helicase
VSVQLWPHQVEAVDRVEAAWSRGIRRPAIVHATGAGKTSTFVTLAQRWLARNPGRRVLTVVDRQELADQAVERFTRFGVRPGVVMGTQNQTLPPVIVGSMQTLANERRRRMLRGVGLVVVDECQIGTTPSIRAILEHFGCMLPPGGSLVEGALGLGVTATMSRADGAALGDIWQDVAHTYTITEGITDGRLVKPVGIRVRVDDLDLRKVKRVGGANSEYRDGSLGEAITDSMAPKKIVEAYREHVPEEPGFVFAPTVDSATVIRDAFREGGFIAEIVHAQTPKEVRRKIVDAFRRGEIQILCNVGVFMKGTDLPRASVCVVARPTVHDGTYIQMVGRVLRVCVGKRGAWVLDVVGATRMHSLNARIELFGAAEARLIEGDGDYGDGQVEVEPVEVEASGVFAGPVEPEVYADGMLVSEIVDLFNGSRSAWMQTRARVWFLEAGNRYVVILPSAPLPGRSWGFDVIAMDRYRANTGRWVKQRATSLAEAMVAAESDVTPAERLTASRGRAWRDKGSSQQQRDTALALGVPGHGSAGEVAERVSVALASERIDPYIPAYARF